jgi:hypothetical protein
VEVVGGGGEEDPIDVWWGEGNGEYVRSDLKKRRRKKRAEYEEEKGTNDWRRSWEGELWEEEKNLTEKEKWLEEEEEKEKWTEENEE